MKERARAMRYLPTAAGEALWQALRGGRVGAKFRRQHPIDRYIVGFMGTGAKLVEVDGGIYLDANQRTTTPALLAEISAWNRLSIGVNG